MADTRKEVATLASNSSVTRSTRIGEDIDQSLRRFSEQVGVSVNFLINKALRKYVEWDSYAERFGMMTLPSALVARMMECLTDEQARELGTWVGSSLVREVVTFWFKEVNPRVVVKDYLRLIAQYSGAFEYEGHAEEGHWVVVLKHDMGPRWSLYYEEVLKSLVPGLLDRDVTVECTGNQVAARFSLL